MNESSRLIGFDIRRTPAAYQQNHWGPRERELFLIRPNTPCPLSVDNLVWPTRFRMEHMPPGPLSAPDDILLRPSTKTRYFDLFGLWDDLNEMISEYKPTIAGDCGLAVGLVFPEHSAFEKSVIQDSWWQAINGCSVRPSTRREKWELLGYDVANSGYTSALSNCGRQPRDRNEAESKWGACLNDFGLFKAVPDAIRFCEASNKTLTSDGPFYVFELFIMWGNLTIPS